jgi:uncharacterized protein (TIGR02391 family)
VLRFCREELVFDNYFHAVLEAAKSVADKLRNRTGFTDDGAVLVDRALAGDAPIIAINALETDSEKSEQRGFANLIKGIFGMFRNTTAHAPKPVGPGTSKTPRKFPRCYRWFIRESTLRVLRVLEQGPERRRTPKAPL